MNHDQLVTLAYTTAGAFILLTAFIFFKSYNEIKNELKAFDQEAQKTRETTKALADISARRQESLYNALEEQVDFDPQYN